MRRFLFLVSAAAACGIAACDKRPSVDSSEDKKRQEQREADERRIVELRELEQRQADRDAAAALADLEKQRNDLAAERAKLEQDRTNLDEQQKRAADARLAKIREEEREAERREELRRAEQRRRDQQLAEERLANQRSEQTLDFFYDALDPEGDWIEVERYGYCWQPRIARQGSWRPYVDGHWAYTNYGWTWVSNEPFGWATYHYGRWTRVRGLGWVWVPGSEWAPAWVSWRRNDRHVGWAPLPPEAHSRGGFTAAVESRYDIGPGLYNFVAVENFGAPTYVNEVLQPEQNITIVRQSVNVTNITYQNVDNRVIVRNEGPQFAEINQRAKVRRMNVERVAQGPGKAEERGDTLRILAPVVAPAAKETRPPKRVRENVKAPEVERGWSGAPAAVVAEVREQQKEEARKSPPPTSSGRPSAPALPPKKPDVPEPPVSQPASVTPESVKPPTPSRPAREDRSTEKPSIAPGEPVPKPAVTAPGAERASIPPRPADAPQRPAVKPTPEEAKPQTPPRPPAPSNKLPAKPLPQPEAARNPSPAPPPAEAANPASEAPSKPPRAEKPAEVAPTPATPPQATEKPGRNLDKPDPGKHAGPSAIKPEREAVKKPSPLDGAAPVPPPESPVHVPAVEPERKQPSARAPQGTPEKPANPLKPFREGGASADRKPGESPTQKPAHGDAQAQPAQPALPGNPEPPANEEPPKKKAKPDSDRQQMPAGLRKKQPAAE